MIKILCFWLLTVFQPSTEKTITVRLVDKETGDAIANAFVSSSELGNSTMSNHLGFLRLNVSENDTLNINHISYQKSEVKIPSVNAFTIELTKRVIDLPTLSLLRNDTTLNVEFKTEDEAAKYLPNWSTFYNSLNSRLIQKVDLKFNLKIYFKVSAEGRLKVINKDSNSQPIIRDIINKELETFNSWEPAVQNNIKVEQTFSLRIKNTLEDIYTIVEESAFPPEGYMKFYDHVMSNMEYPAQARRHGIQGKVYVSFVVDETGSITEVKTVKGIGYGCDEEAVRAVKSSPDWSPPKQRGEAVKQRIILPITFSLGNGGKMLNESRNADFPGGSYELMQYLNKNLKDISTPIPPNNTYSTVKVRFTVDSIGRAHDFEVVSSLTEAHDSEARRVLKSISYWRPAIRVGLPVTSTIVRDVEFSQLSNNNTIYANKLYRQGAKLFVNEKYEKALKKFDKAIKVNPTVLNYYFNRATTYIQLKNFNKACEDLEKIKERDDQALILYKEHCE